MKMHWIVCVQSRSRVVTSIFSRGFITIGDALLSQNRSAATIDSNEPLNHGIPSNYARQEEPRELQGRARMCVIRRNLSVNRYRALSV